MTVIQAHIILTPMANKLIMWCVVTIISFLCYLLIVTINLSNYFSDSIYAIVINIVYLFLILEFKSSIQNCIIIYFIIGYITLLFNLIFYIFTFCRHGYNYIFYHCFPITPLDYYNLLMDPSFLMGIVSNKNELLLFILKTEIYLNFYLAELPVEDFHNLTMKFLKEYYLGKGYNLGLDGDVYIGNVLLYPLPWALYHLLLKLASTLAMIEDFIAENNYEWARLFIFY